MYTLGSLFSGIGGIDLAFTWAGFDVAWQVEIDDYATKVLQRHWPDVPKYRDVPVSPDAAVKVGAIINTYQEWMSSRAGFLAQILASPVKALASQKEPAADCGLSSGVLLASYDPELYSWKTLQLSLPGMEPSLLLTLPKWGTAHRGELFQQPTPERPISDSDGSAWPTPTSQNAKHAAPTEWEKENRPTHLHVMARWSTPVAQDGANNGGPSQFNRNSLMLNAQVMLWPTPTASDTRNRNPSKTPVLVGRVLKHQGPNGISQMRTSQVAKLYEEKETVANLLNPEWVEVLMGYPPGWTSIE